MMVVLSAEPLLSMKKTQVIQLSRESFLSGRCPELDGFNFQLLVNSVFFKLNCCLWLREDAVKFIGMHLL